MKTKIAACLVALVATSACVQEDVPLQLVGAAAGAAVGGVIGAEFGGGLGKMAYITGGVLTGGVVGHEVGRVLSESDMAFYRSTAQKALSSESRGVTADWSNPDTGHSGIIRPATSFKTMNGQTCRHFRSTVAFSDAIETGDGTACHQPDGSWQIVSNYFG